MPGTRQGLGQSTEPHAHHFAHVVPSEENLHPYSSEGPVWETWAAGSDGRAQHQTIQLIHGQSHLSSSGGSSSGSGSQEQTSAVEASQGQVSAHPFGRPSIVLQHGFKQKTGLQDKAYEDDYKKWILDEISGCQFIVERAAKVAEGGKIGLSAGMIARNLNKIRGQLSGDDRISPAEIVEPKHEEIWEALKDFFNQIKKAYSHVAGSSEEVFTYPEFIEALRTLFSDLPLISLVYKSLKLTKHTGTLVWNCVEIYRARKFKKDSISYLEKQTLVAIRKFQKQRQIMEAFRAGTSAFGVTSIAVGGGLPLGTVASMADLLANIVLRLLHYFDTKKANRGMHELMQDPHTSVDRAQDILQNSATLALHLPYFRNVNSARILGILPCTQFDGGPATQGRQNKIVEGLLKQNYPQNSFDQSWLFQNLDWKTASNHYDPKVKTRKRDRAKKALPFSRERDPWMVEYKRVLFLLSTADKQLLTSDWKLFRPGENQPVRVPRDSMLSGFLGELREKIYNKVRSDKAPVPAASHAAQSGTQR